MTTTIENYFKSVVDDELHEKLMKNYNPSHPRFRKEVDTLSKAITYGFDWEGTEEGFSYWRKIWMKALKSEIQQDWSFLEENLNLAPEQPIADGYYIAKQKNKSNYEPIEIESSVVNTLHDVLDVSDFEDFRPLEMPVYRVSGYYKVKYHGGNTWDLAYYDKEDDSFTLNGLEDEFKESKFDIIGERIELEDVKASEH